MQPDTGSRPKRSDEELKSAAVHLHYEISMLFEAVKLAGTAPQPSSLWNAVLESALVHARVLFDFFDPNPGTRKNLDDVIAADFFSGGWQGPNWETKVSDLRSRINKKVAHLSYSRVENEIWELDAFVAPLIGPIRRFLSLVDDRFLDGRWDSLKAAIATVPPGLGGATCARGPTGATGP